MYHHLFIHSPAEGHLGSFQVWAVMNFCCCCCCLIAQSYPTLCTHKLQHTRLSRPSPSPRACSNSCPLSWWCHPAISSSVMPFSSCLQSFPASGSFLMIWLLVSGVQSIGALASVLTMNIQGWFPLGLTDLISLSPRDSQESSSTPQLKSINSSVLSLLYGPALTSIHDYWKNHSFDNVCNYFVDKVMSQLFNMLSRIVVAFLPRSKHLLISWLQSPYSVILELKKIKSVTVSIVSPSIFHEVMGPCAWSSFFECWVLSQLSALLFHLHQEAF